MKNFFAILTALLIAGCSTAEGMGGETVEQDTQQIQNEPDVTLWTPEPDVAGPECVECKWYYCPPLDSVWQKEICMR